MYLRAAHADFDTVELLDFVRANPFGLIITALQSPNFPVIQCTHIPWVLDTDDENIETEFGRLRGHMAKQNPHSKALIEAVRQLSQTNGYLEQEVSVIFNGPAHSYVTPKFYVETKPATGKVVPTWNYSAVQVYGKAKILFDTQNEDTGLYLQKQVTDLSKQSEQTMMQARGEQNGRAWEVSDAPASYVELLKKNIIGIEIDIERIEGKNKMSQEMGKGDREGVVKGFESLKTENGFIIARKVEQRGEMKDAKTSASSNA